MTRPTILIVTLTISVMALAGCTGNRALDLAGSVIFHAVVWQ